MVFLKNVHKEIVNFGQIKDPVYICDNGNINYERILEI